jgi:homospermidine synthase
VSSEPSDQKSAKLLQSAPSIYLSQAGAAAKVRTWCPTGGAQHGLCVTHNESISIADYFTLTEGGEVTFRPTCHYAYLPCDEAMLSWHELLGGREPSERIVLDEAEIVDGIDELGVLLYGHDRNAYWYGSRLSNAQTVNWPPTRTLRVCRLLRRFSRAWCGRLRTRTRASSRQTRWTSTDASRCSYRILVRSKDISRNGTR